MASLDASCRAYKRNTSPFALLCILMNTPPKSHNSRALSIGEHSLANDARLVDDHDVALSTTVFISRHQSSDVCFDGIPMG